MSRSDGSSTSDTTMKKRGVNKPLMPLFFVCDDNQFEVRTMTLLQSLVTGDRYDPRHADAERETMLCAHLNKMAEMGNLRSSSGVSLRFEVRLVDSCFLLSAQGADSQDLTLRPPSEFAWAVDEVVQEHNCWTLDGVRWSPQYTWSFV